MKSQNQYLGYDPMEMMWRHFNLEQLEPWDVNTDPTAFPEPGYRGMDFEVVALTDEETQLLTFDQQEYE